MMKDLSISELSSLFRGYTVVDSADLVKAFNSLCSVAGVSPQAVYDEFELLACTLEDPRLNEENMALLQKRILEEQRKSKAVSQSFTPTRTSRMRMFDATMLNSSSFLTPASKKTNSRRSFISSPSPGIKASPASEAFRSRVNKRLRKIVFNELLLPAYSINERTREKDIRVREIGKSQVRQQEFAYYFNDLEADINKLQDWMSDRLNRILVDINKKASISDIAEDQSPLNIQLSSVNRLHVEEVYIGGRICSPENFQTDLSNREWDRRLHPNSVFLETVDGNRVQLNLQDLDQFSVFPGQVVVCKGRSGFNQQFLVSQIFQDIPSIQNSDESERVESTDRSDAILSTFIAVGPYSLSSELDYSPLIELLDIIVERKPDVAILCGPFVDAEHKKISSNEIEGTFEDEFLGIVDLISQRISSLSIQVFLVPSTRDVHHDALFPQPSFSLPSELKSIRCVENPSLLSLEPFGVTIGISSVDSLMDLSRISLEMIKAEGASPRDRLQDLSALMVKQKSFYPILPPPVRSELNLSMEMLQKLEFEPVPDILICPSLLAQFVKNVECLDSGKTVLCVNPGHLTKGDSAGAYAEITIHPLENKPVCEKTRIDLYKI